MTKRVDQAARAYGVLRWVSSTSMTSAEATASVMAAQTHATLALVEQQRIANLIALAKVAGRDEDVHEAVAEAAYGALDTLVNTMALHPDIAAALGIEVAR